METIAKTKTKWAIDPAHTYIDFKVKHLMIAYVRGSFKRFHGEVYTNGHDFSTAEMDIRIDSSSIDTRNEQRDEHLRGADFLDVKNHKEIRFRARTLERKTDTGRMYELTGDLTIRDVTRKITLQAEFGGITKDPYGNEKAGFTLNGKVNRFDWGLNWNTPLEAGGVMLADEVIIHCDVELTKESSK